MVSCMTSRTARQLDILPQKWEDLNKKLHGYYGYSPSLHSHPKIDNHLNQLHAFVKDQHPETVLIQNWIDELTVLVDVKAKAANLLHHTSEESDDNVSEPIDQPPSKRQKPDDPELPVPNALSTPVKTPIQKNRRKKNDEPEINPAKIGFDYKLEDLISKKEYPPNVAENENLKWWSGDGGKTMELKSFGNNSESTVLVIFGKIRRPAFGIYGDFNSTYHESLVDNGNRLLTLRLVPVDGFVDEFVRQTEAVRKLENLLNDRFDEVASKHRAVKNPQELQISRRLIDRAKKGSFIPQEQEGQNMWSKVKAKGMAANPVPMGVFNIDGEVISFERYSECLSEDRNVVIAARMKATSYNGMFFVKLIPIQIRVVSFVGEKAESESGFFDLL